MTQQDERSLRERLESEIGKVLASDLSAHIKRGVVVVVADDVDLIDVAMAVAEDNVTLVEDWIASKQMRNPSLAQIETWEANPQTPFRSVIVRPYVLVQTASS